LDRKALFASGVVLLSMTKVSVPPRLLPLLYAGEGGSVEKMEGVWDFLQNEEKVESSTTNATSDLTTYPFTLVFLLHDTTKHCACMHCAWHMRFLSMRFLTLAQEFFDHWRLWMQWVRWMRVGVCNKLVFHYIKLTMAAVSLHLS